MTRRTPGPGPTPGPTPGLSIPHWMARHNRDVRRSRALRRIAAVIDIGLIWTVAILILTFAFGFAVTL